MRRNSYFKYIQIMMQNRFHLHLIMFVLIFLLIFSTVHAANFRIDGVLNFAKDYVEQWLNEKTETTFLYEKYDFIIVGAGTAGCVLANRLSEVPTWKILLIEAGQAENLLMDIPIAVHLLQQTPANWDYEAEPSNMSCLAMKGGRCKLPRGKVMGGSSVLNYMIYTRGHREDYNHWAKMGNFEWSYDKVLPYFKKLENFTVYPGFEFDKTYHGTDGPLSVTYPNTVTHLAEAIVRANIEYGLPMVDYNGRTQVGVSYIQVTQKDGFRHSSNTAYIHPIKDRPNLHLLKGTLVRKVLINQHLETVGVLVERDSKIFTIKQSKEVILSAGAINSPQILLLSGIGPKEDLQNLNIPVLKDLPVGKNLMDHIVTGLTFTMNSPLSNKFIRIFEDFPQYLNTHMGLADLAGSCEAIAFVNLDDPFNPNGYPDMELLYISSFLTEGNIVGDLFGVHGKYLKYYEAVKNLEGFTIYPMLLRPESKGYVTLRNTNPKTKPIIVTNYLQHAKDVKTFIKGIKFALNITQEKSLAKDLGVKWYKFPLTPDECPNLYDFDGYLECIIRLYTFTIYHQSGTCKMGPENDRTTVVDQRLRVLGVRGLRVADASIIPKIMAGHPNGPVYMIAEKGADFIKEDWKVFQ